MCNVIALPTLFLNRATRIEYWSWHIGGPDLVSFASSVTSIISHPISALLWYIPNRTKAPHCIRQIPHQLGKAEKFAALIMQDDGVDWTDIARQWRSIQLRTQAASREATAEEDQRSRGAYYLCGLNLEVGCRESKRSRFAYVEVDMGQVCPTEGFQLDVCGAGG